MKKWMNYLPYALVIIILASLIVFSNDSRTENFSWTGRYGELSPGTYRMVREYTLEGQDYSVAVEFAVSGS